MQPYPILQTKLYMPPVRATLVPRPRLIERLDTGLLAGCKLSLISAPAGFGKTTLVTEWIHDSRVGRADLPAGTKGKEATASGRIEVEGTRHIAHRVAWLSLDEADNDLARFLMYLIVALRAIDPDIGTGMLSAVQSPGFADANTPPSVETVLTSLINDIMATPGLLVLALDDYHLIVTQAIHDALAFLLEHMPPKMHLAIATREDPHLPLARLRARGQLAEVRAGDLRFSSPHWSGGRKGGSPDSSSPPFPCKGART
jgi:LuxR family maltose regulon positive regulatory protein